MRWWYRWATWQTTKAQRDAFRAVNENGLDKVTPEQRRLYDSLVIPDD